MSRQMWIVGAVVVASLSIATPLVVSAVSGPPRVVETQVAPSLLPANPAPSPQLPLGVSTEGSTTYYTVQPFDIGKKEGTLTFIAARFGVTVAQLVEWNHIQDPNKISSGQRLRVK